ncbi:hypothetical protein Tco_1347056 [Tanacetum coccineum]
MEFERAIPNDNGARIAKLARDDKDEHANPHSAILSLLPFVIDRGNIKRKFLSKANHGGFLMIMAIVSLSVASVFLLFTSFFLRLAYYFAWKYGCCYQQDERFNEYLFHWTVFLVIIVPILYAFLPFLPPWVQLPFICVGISVIVVVAVTAYIMNHQSEEKQKWFQHHDPTISRLRENRRSTPTSKAQLVASVIQQALRRDWTGRKYGVGLKHGNEIVYQHLKY